MPGNAAAAHNLHAPLINSRRVPQHPQSIITDTFPVSLFFLMFMTLNHQLSQPVFAPQTFPGTIHAVTSVDLDRSHP